MEIQLSSLVFFSVCSLSPYSFDVSPSAVSELPNLTDVPIGAIPLLTTCSPDFQEAINKTVANANAVYQEFLKSEEGKGFNGQVAIIGDSMGAILAHDALCRVSHTRHGSDASNLDEDVYHGLLTDPELDATKLLTAPAPRRRSSSQSDSRLPRFEFETGDFFMFGSPLAIVLAARRLTNSIIANQKPNCQQVYNLFHPTDPIASRIEPLLSARFSMLAPVNIPRYAKYPLGNGQPYHLCKYCPKRNTHFPILLENPLISMTLSFFPFVYLFSVFHVEIFIWLNMYSGTHSIASANV